MPCTYYIRTEAWEVLYVVMVVRGPHHGIGVASTRRYQEGSWYVTSGSRKGRGSATRNSSESWVGNELIVLAKTKSELRSYIAEELQSSYPTRHLGPASSSARLSAGRAD